MNDMKKAADVNEYMELVNTSVADADQYLVTHFGVPGSENFKEGSYNKFVSEVMETIAEMQIAEAAKDNTVESGEQVEIQGPVAEENTDTKEV